VGIRCQGRALFDDLPAVPSTGSAEHQDPHCSASGCISLRRRVYASQEPRLLLRSQPRLGGCWNLSNPRYPGHGPAGGCGCKCIAEAARRQSGMLDADWLHTFRRAEPREAPEWDVGRRLATPARDGLRSRSAQGTSKAWEPRGRAGAALFERWPGVIGDAQILAAMRVPALWAAICGVRKGDKAGGSGTSHLPSGTHDGDRGRHRLLCGRPGTRCPLGECVQPRSNQEVDAGGVGHELPGRIPAPSFWQVRAWVCRGSC
jgi:hypothetical protein